MSKYKQGDLLARINSPSDLRELKKTELPKLSQQLRQYILDIVSENGGHLGASLGVVELTVALHYVFDTPYDQLVLSLWRQDAADRLPGAVGVVSRALDICFYL